MESLTPPVHPYYAGEVKFPIRRARTTVKGRGGGNVETPKRLIHLLVTM